ncbi:MAG: flippase-like domain-containing protein [Kiritimatiellae bacterium]|nr:flippase-like domain-containing protein [Kiritimatiellia bacterium]
MMDNSIQERTCKKDMDQTQSNSGRSFILSAIVTIVVFTYLLTHVSVNEVLASIKEADIRGVLMFVVLSFSMSVVRMWRYSLVLYVSGSSLRSTPLFLVVLVRNFCSDLLPARLGSLIYVYILTNRLGVRFGAAVSSFTLAFFFDLLAVAPIIILALCFMGEQIHLSVTGVVVGGGVLVGLTTLVLYFLPQLIRLIGSLFTRIPFLSRNRIDCFRQALQEAETDLQKAKQMGLYTRLFFLSLLIRILKYGSYYMLLYGILRPLGYGFDKLPIPRVFIGLCTSELSASLPISGIAGFGAYEGAWAFMFQWLGFSKHIATLTSLSHHLFTQVYGYSIGIVALLILILPILKVKK